jgi:hypothetical protein
MQLDTPLAVFAAAPARYSYRLEEALLSAVELVPARDVEEERRSRLLLVDETGSPPVESDCRVGVRLSGECAPEPSRGLPPASVALRKAGGRMPDSEASERLA